MYALDFNSDSVIPAQLVFNGRIMRRLTPLQPSIIDITSRFAPERLRVEGFIKDIYRRSYGADISVTYPMLMSVRDADGHILAAAGFRVAEQEPLFLEQYIQSPIEQVLAGIYNRNVARSDIAEIRRDVSERTERIETFCASPLTVLLLQVARCDIVDS